jgi:transposase InsO family protein
VRIQRVLTDNAKAYAQSILFAETAASLGITRKRTRRYRPQTNGKVERFNKTLLEEWAYARLYRSNLDRRRDDLRLHTAHPYGPAQCFVGSLSWSPGIRVRHGFECRWPFRHAGPRGVTSS